MSLSENEITQCYNSYAKKLINFLVADGLDYSIACDIVQEAFVRLWKKRNEIDKNSSVSGFLFRVVKNLRIDFFRKNNRISFDSEVLDDELPAAESSSDGGDVLQLRELLQSAFSLLSEDLRQTYLLFQVSGYSIKEIASFMDVKESLVKVRIHRAKEKLQKIIESSKDFAEYL